jgi:VanZ family protein
MSPSSTRLSAGTHIRLVLAVVVLVVYGSLFPFRFHGHQPEWTDFSLLFQFTGVRHSISDLIGNVLLFFPYGLLMASSHMSQRLGRGLAAGAVLALLVQYLQFWFPDRDPSGIDALVNIVGMLLGLLFGHLVLPRFLRGMTLDHQRPHFALLTTWLMLLWLVDRWFPMVPSFDVQNFKNGIKPLFDWSHLSGLDVLRHLAGWLVFLRLSRYSPLQRLSLPVGMLLSALVIAVEPLFLNNSIGPDNLIGFALACLLAPWLRQGPASLVVIIFILVLTICLSALMPFDFRWVGGFGWVPFAGSLAGDPLSAIPPMVEKTFWYGCLVFMLRYLGASHRGTSWAAGLLVLALELVQQWLPGRTSEITDPLLVLTLAWAMRPTFQRATVNAEPHLRPL